MVAAVSTPPLRRPDLIGASDVAAVLGVHPWKTGADLWARIVHGIEEPAGDAAYWGLALEPAIARRFELAHGVEVEEVASIVNPKGRAWQRISIDRRVRGSKIDVELKTCSRERAGGLGPAGTDDILVEHYLQVQAQMEALDLEIAFVPYLVAGQDYREYVVEPNAQVQAAIVEACEAFWRDHVLTGKPPPADDPRSIARVYPRVLVDHRPEQPGDADLARSYELARQAKKVAEGFLDEAKAKLCAAVGEAKGIHGAFGRVTWSECKRIGGVDWERVAADMAAELGLSIEQLRARAARHPGKTTNYRRLTVRLAGATSGAEGISDDE